jgi:DNA-binding transcriptional LysR family regulator
MRTPVLRGVDLNLLVAFAELAATGSVTRAATKLGVTQPAMSRTLGRLRKTFGDPLFLRGPGGLVATPRARELQPAVEAWLEQAAVLVAGPPRFDPATAERTFQVATADYAEAVLLPRLLQRLQQEAPRVRLRITTQPFPLDAALEAGELDLAWLPRQAASRQVVWTRLFEESFGFVVRKGHPVLRRPFKLERFLSLRHLAIAPVGRTNSNPLDQLLEKLGHRREVAATVPNFLVVPSLVAGSDVGVTLPRRIVELATRHYPLVSLPLPFALPGFTMHQAWHERVRKDPGHAWLRQLVVDVARGA